MLLIPNNSNAISMNRATDEINSRFNEKENRAAAAYLIEFIKTLGLKTTMGYVESIIYPSVARMTQQHRLFNDV
ncbi:hypothetical protein KQX54_021166 [Cotesia glomerata]|uniref:Uncharacterized protein n=1 Tax=Cotesia glomerata TaxID=32391 RepID=A0AAV7I5R7_COTGL|nr:hypothetical protein KQX54_021166 [Cotesia glomerata]